MAVPPAPVRIPSQRLLGPNVASLMSVVNDKGDNEMILGAVHRSPGICLTAEENPRKPQLGDCPMKGLCNQSSPQMESFPLNEVGRIVQHVKEGDGRKEGKDEEGTIFTCGTIKEYGNENCDNCKTSPKSLKWCDITPKEIKKIITYAIWKYMLQRGKKLEETIFSVMEPSLDLWHHVYKNNYYNSIVIAEHLFERKNRILWNNKG